MLNYNEIYEHLFLSAGCSTGKLSNIRIDFIRNAFLKNIQETYLKILKESGNAEIIEE